MTIVRFMLGIAVAMTALCGVTLNRTAYDAPPLTWAQQAERIDAAIAADDLRAAREAVRDAYASAVSSRHWEPLLYVGTAELRIERASGFELLGKASARRQYLFALFRARDQGSLAGVLRAAEAFASLGDTTVVEQAITVARALAGDDVHARTQVDAASRNFAIHVASANAPSRDR
jgi:hypothetical protein